MNIPRLIGFSIIFGIISFIVHTIGAIAEMPYYLEEAYFPVWSSLMMPGPGTPGAEFFIASLIFSIIGGFLFGLVYALLKSGIPGKRKGLTYGFLIFLVASIPAAMSIFLIINIPSALIFSWTIEALIIFLICGWIAEKVIR